MSLYTPLIHRHDVDKCNDLLRRELGTSWTGLPNFIWGHSSDQYFFHPVRRLHEDGSMKYDYECVCGINVRLDDPNRRVFDEDLDGGGWIDAPEINHKPECKGSIAIPVYTLMNLAERYLDEYGNKLENRWILWIWRPPISPEDWDVQFGTKLSYDRYKRGAYDPSCMQGLGEGASPLVVCVPDGVPPNKELTENLILNIKTHSAQRAQTAQTPWEMELEMIQREAAFKKSLIEQIKEGSLTMGGKQLPGEKGGVSFPTPSRLIVQ